MLEVNSKGAGVRLLNVIFLPVHKQKERSHVQQSCQLWLFLEPGDPASV